MHHNRHFFQSIQSLIEIDDREAVVAIPSPDGILPSKVVAFAYEGAQSQQLYAIGDCCFRYTVWLPARIP